MSEPPRGWDRSMWGVLFTGSQRGERPMLLGATWNRPTPADYDGEPSRALLFKTRATARAWCVGQHEKYRGRTDCCAAWRFRPARVREVISVV